MYCRLLFFTLVLCALYFCSSHLWLDLSTLLFCWSDRCAFKLSLPTPQSRSQVMADNNVWVSAWFPHPFRLNEMVQACRKEERQGTTDVSGAVVSPPPGSTLGGVSGDVKNDYNVTPPVTVPWALASSFSPAIGLDWESSSNEKGPYQPGQPDGHCQSTNGASKSPAPPPPPDRSSTPPTPPVRLPSDVDDSLGGFRAVGCPTRLCIDYREDDGNWFDACRVHQSSPTIREATLQAHVCSGHASSAPLYAVSAAYW